jgi:hypothetical protein
MLSQLDEEEVEKVLEQLDQFVDEKYDGPGSALGEVQEEEESSGP